MILLKTVRTFFFTNAFLKADSQVYVLNYSILGNKDDT